MDTHPFSHLTADTLARVEGFISGKQIAESTFGKLAVGDDGFVDRLRSGRVTFRIAQRALDYIATQEAASVVLASANTGSSVGSVGGGDGTDSGGVALRSPEKRVA